MKNGFTLIEMMVTLSILAILAVMAAPSFSGMLIGNRIVTQTNELVAAIHLSRSEAIKLNRSVTFCKLDSAAATACSTQSGSWLHWGVLAPAGIIRRGTIATGNSLTVSSNLPASGLIFRPDGMTYVGNNFANHRLEIWSCGIGRPADNLNVLSLGAGSRLGLTKTSKGC